MKARRLSIAAVKESRSSPEKVARQILEGLYRGKYVPGQRLIEADLTRELKVGRGTVREALNRLSAEGVVVLSFNRGAQIRALTRSEVDDILAVAEVLVGLAARQAAQKIGDPGNRKLLQASLERLVASNAGEFFEFVRARNAFYRALVQIGGNRELARVLPHMQVHVVRTQFRGYLVESESARLRDYRKITEAVLRASPRKAEIAVQRHIRALLSAVHRLPDDAFAAEKSTAAAAA